MDGIELIRQERMRQIVPLGWTAESDDKQTKSELLYCANFIIEDLLLEANGHVPEGTGEVFGWPGERAQHVREKYGADKVRRLTIAGALIAAEIDRLKRLEK